MASILNVFPIGYIRFINEKAFTLIMFTGYIASF